MNTIFTFIYLCNFFQNNFFSNKYLQVILMRCKNFFSNKYLQVILMRCKEKHIGSRVKCPLFSFVFIHIFPKYLIAENVYSSHVFSHMGGWMDGDTDGQAAGIKTKNPHFSKIFN